MKIEWVNNGKNFEPPKVNADMDVEILTYLDALPDEIKNATNERMKAVRNIYEFKETVFLVLNSIDTNVTKEMIAKNLSVNELGTLYVVMRQHGKTKYVCPHCKKGFVYEDMPQEGDTPLPENKPSGITETKKKQ